MNAVQPVKAPDNIEAEFHLVGALLLRPDQIDRCADAVRQEDFAEEWLGHVYSLILNEHAHGRRASPVTLRPLIEPANHQLLAQLTGNIALHAADALDLSRHIADLGKRRRLMSSLASLLAKAARCERSVVELAADVEMTVAESTRETDGMVELTAGRCAELATKAAMNPHGGVTSGIVPIDEAMGAVREGNFAVLAGRPGMGKTAVGLSYARGAASRGHGVLFISLEMNSEELGERLLCDICFDNGGQRVRYERLVTGSINQEELGVLVRAAQELEGLPLQVIDAAGMTISRLATVVRRWRRRFEARGKPLKLVVIDYLQLLDAQTHNRFEEVTAISRACKRLAKENRLGVLALAQLSRRVEERDDKRPVLSDLRESGQIEQDADAVMFLLRKEYYLAQSEPPEHSDKWPVWRDEMDSCAGQLEFICAKRRKGAPRTRVGLFDGAHQAVRA